MFALVNLVYSMFQLEEKMKETVTVDPDRQERMKALEFLSKTYDKKARDGFGVIVKSGGKNKK